MARRSRRRTRQKERRTWKKRDWLELFPKEMKMVRALAWLQPKMQKKVLLQSGQNLGRLREEKVFLALQDLKIKGEIRDFLWMGKLSHADLIEGVDFIFTYVNGGRYNICRFSVTGWRWVPKHLERHPEIPTFAVGLDESMDFIKQKILASKNNHFS